MEPTAYRDMAASEREHWWFVGRRRIIEDTIRNLALPPDAQILEVGAGTGGNVELLRRHGRLSAVELDDYAREHLRDTTGLDVQYGALPDELPDFPEPFDLICLFDVLEHVERDVEALGALGRRLAPGGRLLVTVPAYPWMWSGHDTVLHHFRRYTRKGLAGIMREAGLEVDRLTNFNTLLFPAAAAARLATAAVGGKGSPGSGTRPGSLNTALGRVFSSERVLLRRTDLPFGLSLMAVASR